MEFKLTMKQICFQVYTVIHLAPLAIPLTCLTASEVSLQTLLKIFVKLVLCLLHCYSLLWGAAGACCFELLWLCKILLILSGWGRIKH